MVTDPVVCRTLLEEGRLCDAHASGHTGPDCGWIGGEKTPPQPVAAPTGSDYPAEYFQEANERLFP
jgi:hypothetical protein